MITNEMLAADAALSGLTDEQRNAIVTMSKNDEEVVIGNRFREVYNQLDATIAKETGIARNGDEKTYLYLERAAKTLAAKANSVDGLNSKINDLTKERDKLQKALEEGGDETTKKQLAQANKDLTAIRQQYDTLKGDYDKMKNDHAAELLGVQIDNVLTGAKNGLKFKAEFPQAAVDTLLAQAEAKVKGMSPEFIDDGKGGKRLVFKGENGEIARNPENHLEPFTADELLKKELRAMGILDEGRKATGTSTTTTTTTTSSSTVPVDVSMAKTQNEAENIIHNQLNAQGLVRGSKAYQEAMTQAWKDNNISSLPIQ
jgi:hypothetical protein